MRWIAAVLIGAVGILLAQQPKEESPEQARLISSLEGRALYDAHCAVCHGSDARGGGPMAKVLRVPPPDLTRIVTRERGPFPTRKIEKIIAGDADVSSHGTREMPLWGPIFSQVAWDQDLGKVRIRNLAKYLENIQTTAPDALSAR
jgi:mono/diheme cytochrome c family protein